MPKTEQEFVRPDSIPWQPVTGSATAGAGGPGIAQKILSEEHAPHATPAAPPGTVLPCGGKVRNGSDSDQPGGFYGLPLMTSDHGQARCAADRALDYGQRPAVVRN